MKMIRTGGLLELRNSPGCLRAFSLPFIAGGAFCLALVYRDAATLSLLERSIATFIGGGVLAGGVFNLASTPRTRLLIDRERRHIVYERTAPLRRAYVVEAPFAAVRDIEVRRTHDSDGDPWFVLTISLDDGHELELGGVPEHGRAALQSAVTAVREQIGPGRSRV